MKYTGVSRKPDGLGRIVLPKEIRDNLEIGQESTLDIFTDGRSIILKKHLTACAFCGGHKNIKLYKGIPLCRFCAKEIGCMVESWPEPEKAG